AGGCCNIDYHVQVSGLTAIDYYIIDVNSDSLIAGEYYLYGNNYDSGYMFSYLTLDDYEYYQNGNAPIWYDNGFAVDGLWSNPWWDGINETDLHALRNTMQWVP